MYLNQFLSFINCNKFNFHLNITNFQASIKIPIEFANRAYMVRVTNYATMRRRQEHWKSFSRKAIEDVEQLEIKELLQKGEKRYAWRLHYLISPTVVVNNWI